MSRRLWIVDPSLATAEHEGTREIAACWEGESRLTLPALKAGDGPGPGDGYDADALVVMGSAASVDDELPWLQDLSEWLRPIVDGEVELPLLGICFGHQLLAHLAGAEVDFNRSDRKKRLAVETTRIDGSRFFPSGEHRVVVSHREQVTSLPAGYRAIAARPGVPLDGIEHLERPLASFQFHPEAREEFADRTGLGKGMIDARLREDSESILRAFLS